ncbi:regulatory signaling modulator protein AmpE [Salinisphaera sp. SPP-AMP-43]|uniref:regulatory signaling modulator protein AmpE n=1 Tax=Salinisphaera sp. SPP-AMP-43 TaxID=3121288 RepID=UPI003C6E8477
MHLIVIVVALLLERTLGQLSRLRQIDAFAAYVRLIERSRLGRAWLARPFGVAVILPPLAVFGVLQWMIDTHLWLGAQLVFGLIGLLISLGPRDLWEDVYALAHARSEQAHDEVEARAVALCRRASGRRARDIDPPTIVGAVLVQGHERVLAVLLWFFVAGPTGALFYRLVRELPALAVRDPATRQTARVAEYVHGLAAWIPARIVALVYVIAGQSGQALAGWRTARASTHVSGIASWRLLAAVGRGALGVDSGLTDQQCFDDTLLGALSLISRSVLILLAGFALLTLAGIFR